MADIFSYTTADTLVAPSSPTIQVRANTQAADTFKSLQDLLSTGIKAKTQQVENERAVLGEAMQLQRMHIANVKEANRLKEDAETAARKEEELRLELMAKEQISGAQTIYDTTLASLAQDDFEGRLKVTSDFNAAMTEIYGQVPASVQKSLFGTIDSRRQNAQKAWLDYAKEHGINTFKDQITFASPDFINADFDQQQEMFTKFQEGFNRRGGEKKDFGEFFGKVIGSHLALSLDQGNIVENRDFASLEKAKQTLINLRNIDPRAGQAIEAEQNTIDGIETQLRSAVRGDVDLARQANDKDSFEQLLKFGVQNGVYTPDQAQLEYGKFVKSNYNETKMNEYYAKLNLGYTEGNTRIDSLPDGQRGPAKKMITDMLSKMLRGGTLEPNKLRFHAQNNPEIFRREFKQAFAYEADSAMSIAQAAMAEKDENKQAQYWNMYLAKVERLDALASVSNYTMETDELVNRSIVKAVAMSNGDVSIAKIRENMEQRGGDILVHAENGHVKKIYDTDSDIPQDQRSEAHRVFSALVASNMEQSVAYETVVNSFKFAEIDGTNLSISGNVQQILNQANMGADSMKYLVDTLLNDGSVAGLEDETFTEDVRSNLQAVMDGTNPTARMYKGHLMFENEEGTTAMIRFNQDDAKALAEATNTAFRASSEGQAPTGVPLIAEDVAQAVSVEFSEQVENVTTKMDAVAASAEVFADSFFPSWEDFTTLVDMELSGINQLIDDVYKGVPFAEANEAARARTKKNFANYVERIDEAVKDSDARQKEAWDKVKQTYLDKVESGRGNTAENLIYSAPAALEMIDSVIEFVIPKAYGADQPEGEYYQQGSDPLALTVTNVPANNTGNNFTTSGFYRSIGENAEGKHGYDSTTQTYKPVVTSDAAEANRPDSEKTYDVGYGHKVKAHEWASGMIHGHRFYDPETKEYTPLTQAQVDDILEKDMAENLSGVLSNWNRKVGNNFEGYTFSDLSQPAQAVLTSLAFNVGSESAKAWNEIFNNEGLMYRVMLPEEVEKFATDLRRQDAGSYTRGMDNRVMKELVAAGLIYDQSTYDLVAESLPLMNEYPTFESTQN